MDKRSEGRRVSEEVFANQRNSVEAAGKLEAGAPPRESHCGKPAWQGDQLSSAADHPSETSKGRHEEP